MFGIQESIQRSGEQHEGRAAGQRHERGADVDAGRRGAGRQHGGAEVVPLGGPRPGRLSREQQSRGGGSGGGRREVEPRSSVLTGLC